MRLRNFPDDSLLDELLAQARHPESAGGKAAAEHYFRICAPRVYRVVRRYLSGPDAEDVTQDSLLFVFEQAWRAELRPLGKSHVAWLLTIAKHKASARRKSQVRERARLARVHDTVPQANLPDEAPDVLARQLLQRAIADLPSAQQRAIENLLAPRAVAVEERPPLVRSNLSKALKRLFAIALTADLTDSEDDWEADDVGDLAAPLAGAVSRTAAAAAARSHVGLPQGSREHTTTRSS